jgi:DNA-directed RNA polymerase subunit RPC12/RpoP
MSARSTRVDPRVEGFWYVGRVGQGDAAAEHFEVSCPHCKRSFEGELLTGDSPRQRGFKCPYCRLFVPYDRGSEEDVAGAAQ